MIHLFAGKEDPRWKNEEGDGVVVVCLDVLGGCDLLHNQHLAPVALVASSAQA